MSASPDLDAARAALHRAFGYPAFRAGQERAVAAVLARRDTLVILPTGGGKSLCFQVPALLLPGLTVVISPLISLMKDQVDALAARGLPATFVNSTLTANETADRLARTARGEVKLLYVAPERFDAGGLADRLRAIGVSLLAVDEAHCISEWGHDFRPSYLRVREVRDRLGAPPAIALTATATPEVRRDIVRHLGLRDPEVVITGFDRQNLHYHVVPTRTAEDKDRAVVRLLREHAGLAVVYAATRRAVERIARVLERARVPAMPYHAGLDDERRHAVQDAFMREEVRAIVATNAFGMGIDKPNVRLVVHHAMPGTLEAYYQEAGRAGRDGAHADCVLLHAFPDRFTHEFFIKSAYPERASVERAYELVTRAADAAGLAAVSPAELAAASSGVLKERDADAALRILAQGGALRLDAGTATRVRVRLLATTERIRAELAGEPHAAERELLRAFWRVYGAALYDGVLIDPDGLPPGFGGTAGATALLDGLASRQFVTWERTGSGIRLTDRGAPVSRFPIDWEILDRRRRADLGKLDAVQRYAYTTGCRRAYVLRYFGDPAARDTCDGCDNCLGTHERAPGRAEKPARPVERRARRAARDDVPRAGRMHGGARSPDAAGDAPPEPPELDGAGLAVVGALRRMRSELARQARVPAYCIFADRTLLEIAARRPATVEALARVHGVGPSKLEKYGERVLAVVRDANDTEAA